MSIAAMATAPLTYKHGRPRRNASLHSVAPCFSCLGRVLRRHLAERSRLVRAAPRARLLEILRARCGKPPGRSRLGDPIRGAGRSIPGRSSRISRRNVSARRVDWRLPQRAVDDRIGSAPRPDSHRTRMVCIPILEPETRPRARHTLDRLSPGPMVHTPLRKRNALHTAVSHRRRVLLDVHLRPETPLSGPCVLGRVARSCSSVSSHHPARAVHPRGHLALAQTERSLEEASGGGRAVLCHDPCRCRALGSMDVSPL